MSQAYFVIGALGVWVLGGLIGYYFMVRRGHPHPYWLMAGLLLGPFASLVFVDRAETSSHVVLEEPAAPPSRPKIVVGLDRSAESDVALAIARRLAEARGHCLVLCEVVDYDAESDPAAVAVAAVRARLEQIAATFEPETAIVEVLAGRPAVALAEAAEHHDADLVVVGTRGRGLSRRLLGSVAEELLRKSQRPVLVATPGSADHVPTLWSATTH